MIIVADSGATKVDWRSTDGTLRVSTNGINPVITPEDEIESILREKIAPLCSNGVEEFFFYGAGVISGEPLNRLKRVFEAVFPDTLLHFDSDIVAAARALCGNRPGIASIIGTGSNSAMWSGAEIVANCKSGGFILGDEASGAYLGKMLISDYIKGLVPAAISSKLEKSYNLSYPEIVQRVYKEASPNQYLSSFSPFIYEYRNHPYIVKLISSAFDQFLIRNLSNYDYKRYTVNFVGSIAYIYSDILAKRVAMCGMKMGKVLRSPIDELLKYHKSISK
jgi:N-acetylglucosamine kinase-like BadF-type ATPase